MRSICVQETRHNQVGRNVRLWGIHIRPLGQTALQEVGLADDGQKLPAGSFRALTVIDALRHQLRVTSLAPEMALETGYVAQFLDQRGVTTVYERGHLVTITKQPGHLQPTATIQDVIYDRDGCARKESGSQPMVVDLTQATLALDQVGQDVEAAYPDRIPLPFDLYEP